MPTSKKRKQGVSEKNEQKQEKTKRLKERDGVEQKKSSKPLAGKILAVSTLLLGASGSTEGEGNSSGASYNSIIAMCKASGATTTGQVHKRVNYVVVTESAVENPTQRVRKAWKKQIPVVRAEWVQQCIGQKKIMPIDPYIILPSKDFDSREKRKNDDSEIDTHQVDHQSGWSEAVELGCCCSCHENGPDQEKKCPWCTECSVNNAKLSSSD